MCKGKSKRNALHQKGRKYKPKEYIYTISYLQEGTKIPD
jgi:hypothetical protein